MKAHGRVEACDVVHSIGLDDQDTVGGSVPPHSCSQPAQRCSAPCILLRSQTCERPMYPLAGLRTVVHVRRTQWVPLSAAHERLLCGYKAAVPYGIETPRVRSTRLNNL